MSHSTPEVKYEIDDNNNVVQVDELDIKPDVKNAKPEGKRKRTGTSATKAKPEPEDTDDYKPAKRARARSGGGKRWTAAELEALFLRATVATPNFADAVPGRTANQCHQTWRATIVPFIIRSLQERGNAAAGRREE